jgi:hypothetical protein
MNYVALLRYLGNICLVLGYYTILWGDMKTGLVVKCLGGLLTVPFALKLKLWDVLFISGLFTFIEVSKILYLISGSR